MELFALFHEAATKFTTKDAVVCYDGKNTTSFTYQDLLDACSMVCQCLQQSIKNSHSSTRQIIAISFLEQDALHIALLLGILKNESAFVFIPESDILASFSTDGCCSKLNVSYVFIQQSKNMPSQLDSHFTLINSFQIFGENILLFERKDETNSAEDTRMTTAVYAVQTSGTTGNKKIVRVTQNCIVPNIHDFIKLFNLNEHDAVLLSAPFTFDPSVIDIFIALTTGAVLIILANSIKSHPPLLLDILFPSKDLPNLLRGHQFTILQTTPSLLLRWSQTEIRTRILNDESKLKVLALGGEECISWNILRMCKSEGNKTQVFNLYGLTEMSCWASCSKVCFEGVGEEGKIPLGSPLTDTYFKVDATNEDSAGNKIGELILGTQRRFCYVDDASEPPTEFKTGDLVTVSNGNFFFLGRRDRMIKCYGIKVNLQEIEDRMNFCTLVVNCHCVYEQKSSTLYILISLRDGQNPDGISDVRSHFHRTFGHTIPPIYRLILVEEFPVTHNGKFSEEEMLDALASDHSNMRSKICVKNVWGKFKDIWFAHGLKIQGGFKDIGGTSLSAVEIISSLNKQLPSKDRFKLLSLLLSNGSYIQSLRLLKKLLLKNQRIKPHTKFKLSFKRKYSLVSLRLQKHKFKQARFYLKLKKVPKSQKKYLKVIYLRPKIVKKVFRKNSNIFRSHRKALKPQHVCSVIARGLHFSFDYLTQFKTPEPADLNQIKISIVWKRDLMSCVDNSPSILHSPSGGSHIVISSHHGLFTSLNVDSGKVLTSYDFRSDLVSSPCLVTGSSTLESYSYIGCFDGRFCKINNFTGKIVWCFKSQSLIKARAVQVAGFVFFGSYDLHLYCLGEKTGNLRWKLYTGHKGIHANLLLVRRLSCICVCTLSGHVYCVDIQLRRIKWVNALTEPIFSSPCFLNSHGFVVVSTVKGYCVGFSAQMGDKMWSLELNEPVYSDIVNGPCEEIEAIFVCATQEGTILCYEVTKDLPVQQWKTNFGGKFSASPFFFPLSYKQDSSQNPFAIALVNTDGLLRLLTLSTGNNLGELALPGEVFSSPIAYFDRIFVGCRDNNIYCLKFEAS